VQNDGSQLLKQQHKTKGKRYKILQSLHQTTTKGNSLILHSMIGEVGTKGKPYWKAEVLKFLASDFIGSDDQVNSLQLLKLIWTLYVFILFSFSLDDTYLRIS
jgi:hypothetical protein